MGKDGFQCLSNCPVTCRDDEMFCPGDMDHWNGCQMEDYCMPAKGKDNRINSNLSHSISIFEFLGEILKT